MYFKRLEMFGFKSFAERTKINFERGITAVVGPNGTGKCLSKNSLVLLSDGSRIRISELVEEAFENLGATKLDDGISAYNPFGQLRVLTLNPETLKIETAPVTSFIKRKAPPYLLDMKTRSGRRIKATHYHPFFTIEDGVLKSIKSEDLKIGVKIATPRQINIDIYENNIDLFKLLEKFQAEDRVFIPTSQKLLSTVKSWTKKRVNFNRVNSVASIEKIALKPLLDRKSINAYNLSRLISTNFSNLTKKEITHFKTRYTSKKFKIPYKLTPELVRFFGYIISEGGLYASGQVYFVNSDKDVIKDFCRCVKTVFNVTPSITQHSSKRAETVFINSKALCKYLDRVHGLKIKARSRTKRIPDSIFNASKEIIGEFLSALFIGDGYFCTNNGKESGVYVEYATASEELARDVFHILLRLGVQSVIREKRKKATNSPKGKLRLYYSVYIYGIENIKELAQHMKLVGKKKEQLEHIVSLHRNSNPNRDLIPGVIPYIKDYIQASKISVKSTKKACPKLQAYYENACEPSRGGIKEVVAVVEDKTCSESLSAGAERLLTFAESDIYWDEIIEISKVYGEKWVYDLEVRGTHNYLADDFIVHNSNVADAVKWVLGEQSAKSLRGSQMQDVIFNGTELKEPLGYAEVALTLSNEAKFLPIEYDEVTISRRLYRSGESEYLINKNPVRLRDVNELLMGSGIGTSAYSMIEQGKIDQILSANPDERRIVFEEASGITKYKTKKREAIRKLEHTEQNLLRINDIIKEVERQINSIERQARKARRYQEAFGKLKELDTKLAVCRYSQMKERQSAIELEKNNIKDNENNFQVNISEFNDELDTLNNSLDELNTKISKYNSEKNQTNISLQRNQDKVALNRERVQELYGYEAQHKEEIESLGARVSDTTKAMNDVTARLTFISDNNKAKENLLLAKEEEITTLRKAIVENEESVKTNKLRVVDAIAAQSRLRNEVTKVTSDMQNVSARLRRLNLEKDNVSGELTGLEKSLSEARSTVNAVISRIEALDKERITFQNSLRNEKDASELLEKRLEDSKNNIFSLRSKLNFLRDLLKRHEGFTGGTQALLNSLSENKLALSGTCEPIAELIEPKKGYEAACEAALFTYIQNVVVDDWSTAFEALTFLARNKSGKASFMKNYLSSPELSGAERIAMDNRLVVGSMLEFIKFDFRFNALFTRLLKSTFLVNTIEDGVSVLGSLPENMQSTIRLVTKKGDVITRDVITGGSVIQDFTSSIIGRQKRIKETEAHIDQSEKSILTLKQELQEGKARIEEWQVKVKRSEGAIRTEEIELAQKRSQETNLEKEAKRIKEEFDLVDLEIEESMLRQSELKDRETEFKAKLDEAEKGEAELQDLIAGSQAFIEKGAKNKEELLISITEIKTELASLKREEDEIFRQAQTQKNYHLEQERILESKRNSLNESRQRQKELKEEIERLQSDTGSLKERGSVVEKQLKTLEKEASRLREEIDQKESSLSGKKDALGSIKDKVHNIEMEAAQITFQMESLNNKIGQIYKIDLREITEIENIEDLETAQKEVDELTKAVEKIGPVNLVAIDEHKELEERFNFLKKQREDLVNAKESLLKAIKKINQTTRSLFMETFTAIQEEFKNYFRFLFGGGKAEIVLLDERDVLESGIEIIVRPPGKKLQTISLLSGGEKALTAIALLFAIFKVKPSPFCLLDEIDAPLDESNIGRFSKALQEFAKKSQFIIITHNKKTISAADVMYGITMEQSGVSRIISVKFGKKAAKKEAVLA